MTKRSASVHGPMLLLPCTIAIVTALIGLWPLDFSPENQVHWLDNGSGIQFRKHGPSATGPRAGIVYSRDAIDVPSIGQPCEGVSIDMLVRARDKPYPGLAYLMSFYAGQGVEPLVIGQWKSDVEIICRSDAKGAADEHRHVSVPDALQENTRVLVTIASGRDCTEVYLNGRLAKSFPLDALIGSKQLRGHLVLGSASDGGSSWVGDLYGLALYNGRLSPAEILQNCRRWGWADGTQVELQRRPLLLYMFEEQTGVTIHNRMEARNHLTIPATGRPLERDVLMLPWKCIRGDRVSWLDLIGNVLFFIPLSFCMVMYLIRIPKMSSLRAAALTVLLGAVLSLAIELGQSFLPTRYSSLHDLLCNLLGATAGIVLFGIIHGHYEVKRLHVPNGSQGF